jgi:hypothetical protein
MFLNFFKNRPTQECHMSNAILGKDFDLDAFGSF